MISPSGARCACPCRDALQCIRSRYGRPYDDDPDFDLDEEGCQCGCHDEFRCEEMDEEGCL